MTEIHGTCPQEFDAVREAFAANFAEGKELGARFAACIDGEVVVDLWGGIADRRTGAAFDERTLTQLFSTTKAIAALLIARLVDAGKLAYDQPVTEVWPQFAQGGKGAITVEQVMSHQEGLAGFPDPMEARDWYDWDAICAKLAAMTPLWPPGSASGYHPVTYGFLAGEIFRRVDGRTMAEAVREDFSEPFDLDFWIGIPDSEHHRAAELQRPTAIPSFGDMTEATQVAFLKPWSSPGEGAPGEAKRAPIPSTNGYATAPALARLMSPLACEGRLDGVQVLKAETAAAMARERIRGQDLVLPFVMSWGAGVMRNELLQVWGPGKQSFGHSGWGGSCAFADPERRLSAAYVMNKQDVALIGDARAKRLIEAVYGSL